jgi:hypothetical protein
VAANLHRFRLGYWGISVFVIPTPTFAPVTPATPPATPAPTPAPAAKKDADDDDFDVFGDDEDGDAAEEAPKESRAEMLARLKKEAEERTLQKEAKQRTLVAIEIKPWDVEQDLMLLSSRDRDTEHRTQLRLMMTRKVWHCWVLMGHLVALFAAAAL